MFCKYCGEEIKNGSKFCPKCGGDLVLKNVKDDMDKKRNKKIVAAGAVLIFFAIVIMLSYLLWSSENKKNQEIQKELNKFIGTWNTDMGFQFVIKEVWVNGGGEGKTEISLLDNSVLEDNAYYGKLYCSINLEEQEVNISSADPEVPLWLFQDYNYEFIDNDTLILMMKEKQESLIDQLMLKRQLE